MDEMPQLNRIALQQSEAFTCELSQEIHNTTVQILFAIYLSTPPKKGGTDLEKLDLHYKKIYCIIV